MEMTEQDYPNLPAHMRLALNAWVAEYEELKQYKVDAQQTVERLERELSIIHHKYQALVNFYDKHNGTPCEQVRHQAEIAELQAQLAAAQQNQHVTKVYDCGSCAIREGLEQQVAQLREERDEAMQYAAGMDNDLQKIGAQHAALLGLVCELPLPVGELFIEPDVPASLEPMWWQVRIRNQYGFSLMLAEFRDKQIAKAFLAIMTYRATLPRVGGAQS